jgi:superfamily II DNA or RNA helicase
MTSRSTLGSVFSVHRDLLPSAVLECARESLCFRSLSGAKYGFGESQKVELFSEDDMGYVTVPRRYAFAEFPKEVFEGAADLVSDGSPTVFEFNEEKQSSRPELKERQDLLIDQYLSALEGMRAPMRGGILCAPCGMGKTVIASKLFAKLNRTTLVVVHKEFLCDQWRDRLISFLDIKTEEIGIAQQDKCEFEGKKIVIAMVQSLLDKDRYSEEFKRWPGVVCFDEVHRMGAPQFQLAASQFPARYRIGLTATPRRSDGLQPVFEWHIGKIIAKMEGGNEVIPKIHQKKFSISFPEHMYCWRDDDGNIKKLFLGKLVSLLAGTLSRTQWFVKELVRAAAAGRKCMLLSDRREHLDDIKGLLERGGTTATIGYYVGGMKKEERERSAECDIILGTFQMAKEGLDIPEIDTLFLATPKTDVEQSVGRILRYHEDKKEPIVVDLVDTIPICIDFARKRSAQYKRLKWTICATVV